MTEPAREFPKAAAWQTRDMVERVSNATPPILRGHRDLSINLSPIYLDFKGGLDIVTLSLAW